MKRILPYIIGIVMGFALCAVLLFITSQPRGDGIRLLPAPTQASLVVDIDGAVVHPGVYLLPPGSRVQDVITQAGGLTEQADTTALNQASRLRDGQKLTVPVVQNTGTDISEAASSLIANFPIDLNLATLEDLDSLPGIGQTRAQDILNYREAHGGFHSIDELLDVPGIGENTFNNLKELVMVDFEP